MENGIRRRNRQKSEHGVSIHWLSQRHENRCRVGNDLYIIKNKSRSWQEYTPWGTDPAKELSRHPVYGQAGRRRLGRDPIRHGRFAAIVIRAYKAFIIIVYWMLY